MKTVPPLHTFVNATYVGGENRWDSNSRDISEFISVFLRELERRH